MNKLTETYRFRITKGQWATLQVLDTYGVNVSQFIRDAIKEKINKDWNKIKKEKQNKSYFIPF